MRGLYHHANSYHYPNIYFYTDSDEYPDIYQYARDSDLHSDKLRARGRVKPKLEHNGIYADRPLWVVGRCGKQCPIRDRWYRKQL